MSCHGDIKRLCHVVPRALQLDQFASNNSGLYFCRHITGALLAVYLVSRLASRSSLLLGLSLLLG